MALKTEGNKGPGRTPQLIVAAMLLGLAGLLWFGQDRLGSVFAAFTGVEAEKRGASARSEPKVPVVLDKVGSRSDDASIEAIATGRARLSVTLYPDAAGEITEIAVKAGQKINKGEIIAQMDSRAARLAVALARVRVEEAQNLMERSEQLQRRNVNSEAKVQDTRLALERARLELKQAEEALADRVLVAPFEGVVGIPKVEAGDRVATTTAIVTIDDRSEILVEIAVPEEFVSRLEIGQKVIAMTPSFPDRKFEGILERIDSRIDPVSRTIMVRAGFPNPDDELRPGMSFAVELIVPGKSYRTVPELALQWSKGESYVWRIADGKAEKVPVRSVRRFNREILVDGGLRDGDLVVVEGVQRLRPGRAVSFVLPDPAPGS